MISLLAISVSISPSLNLVAVVKAHGQNQSSPSEMSQEGRQKLDELAQKFRGMVTNSGVNPSLRIAFRRLRLRLKFG
jgi:hypothetical protein